MMDFQTLKKSFNETGEEISHRTKKKINIPIGPKHPHAQDLVPFVVSRDPRQKKSPPDRVDPNQNGPGECCLQTGYLSW